MHREPLRYLHEFALDLAWRAGKTTLAHFQSATSVEYKHDASPVTIADRNAERLLRQRIEEFFPQDGIVGEEFGETRPDAPRRWILDPIDGTRTFIHGVPLYGTLIGIEENGQPLVGVIHMPALSETVSAVMGEGCWWNGRRARVSPTALLAEALVLTTDAEAMERYHPGVWNRVSSAVQKCRTWGDCYGYALVATGRAEAMFDARMAVWDAAAVLPVIHEAGGIATDLRGRVTHTGGDLMATNAALADPIRQLVSGDQ